MHLVFYHLNGFLFGKIQGSSQAAGLAERSKASDLSSDTRTSAWVRTPHPAKSGYIFIFLVSIQPQNLHLENNHDIINLDTVTDFLIELGI